MIIHAPNIHTGGGKILLDELLQAITESATLIVDERYILNDIVSKNIQVIQIKPTIVNRIKAEWILYKLSSQHDRVLCFGNLPPLLRLNCKTILFFQNVIMLRKFSHFKFKFRTKFQQAIERFWLGWGMSNVDQVIVQTESVKSHFLSEFPKSNVQIIVFNKTINHIYKGDKFNDFVYVASGDPHKNHLRLLEAWILLSKMNIKPSLILTTSQFDSATEEVFKNAKELGLNIQTLDSVSHNEVLDLYLKSKALIYPSLAESLGLPLLEATQVGLPIIASEVDYVRDVSRPTETFDPQSSISIARAVQRFLNQKEMNKSKIESAESFIKLVCTF